MPMSHDSSLCKRAGAGGKFEFACSSCSRRQMRNHPTRGYGKRNLEEFKAISTHLNKLSKSEMSLKRILLPIFCWANPLQDECAQNESKQWMAARRADEVRVAKRLERWQRPRSFLPGAFKLDHLQPFKPILFWQFSILSHPYTGRPILIIPGG